MAKTKQLVRQLTADHPGLKFQSGDDFYWSAGDGIIYFVREESDIAVTNLLHETAHALLGHKAFKYDIDLIRAESEAWAYAKGQLAPKYHREIGDGLVEDALDSYRDWLHKRSLCPNCGQTGLEDDDKGYHCLSCQTAWRPNDARRCGLRRYVRN